ncbi:cyclic lactone autoinducer peptide [Priestia sp. RMT2NF4]
MKFLIQILFSFFYLVANTEVKTASFFLIHEPKIPQQLKIKYKNGK